MKQFKSDGRYKFYSNGLHYIAEFGWVALEERRLFAAILKQLEAMHGPVTYVVQNEGGYSYRRYNENYRSEQNRKAKRRRIYLRDESDLTLALLRADMS